MIFASFTFSHSLVATGTRAGGAARLGKLLQNVGQPADTVPSPPQSVLGALIAVNLKNSLKQLADPFYLWKKSKLDCVSARGRAGDPWSQPGEVGFAPVPPAPRSASPGRAARRAYHGGLNYYLLCLNANQVQEPVCPELAKPALLNI